MCAAFLTAVGFIGALFAFWGLGYVVPHELVPDRLGAWLWWHPEGIYAIALGCGLALAAIVDQASRLRRHARDR